MSNLAYADDYTPRLEMIDGTIVMMSPRPTPRHMLVSDNIFGEFRIYLKGKKCVPFSDGVAVFLDDKNYFVPDMTVVCDRDKIKTDGIHGAPDLVVEVLSPGSMKRDRGRKKDIYEAAGVKEYWIVDINNKSIEIYLNGDKGFVLDSAYEYYTQEEIDRSNTLSENDPQKLNEIITEFEVPNFKGLIIKLEDIFGNMF